MIFRIVRFIDHFLPSGEQTVCFTKFPQVSTWKSYCRRERERERERVSRNYRNRASSNNRGNSTPLYHTQDGIRRPIRVTSCKTPKTKRKKKRAVFRFTAWEHDRTEIPSSLLLFPPPRVREATKRDNLSITSQFCAEGCSSDTGYLRRRYFSGTELGRKLTDPLDPLFLQIDE